MLLMFSPISGRSPSSPYSSASINFRAPKEERRPTTAQNEAKAAMVDQRLVRLSAGRDLMGNAVVHRDVKRSGLTWNRPYSGPEPLLLG